MTKVARAKGLELSQKSKNSGVYGHRMCLLFSQILFLSLIRSHSLSLFSPRYDTIFSRPERPFDRKEAAIYGSKIRKACVRQTRRELDSEIIRDVYEDGFPKPKHKPFTFKDDEYQPRHVRHSETYLEYAKDICENYHLDLRRCKLIKERRQYIGVDSHDEYAAMCEDLTFLRQVMKTMLDNHLEIFNTRFAKGLSIRKSAEELQVNRGVIERRQMALYEAFAQLLQARDQADGVCRIENQAKR